MASIARPTLRALALALVLGLATGAAHAAPVAIAFEGTLTAVEDPGGQLPARLDVAPGDAFAGQLSFERPGTDLDSASGVGRYEQDAAGALSLELDGLRFRPSPESILPLAPVLGLDVRDRAPGAGEDAFLAAASDFPALTANDLLAGDLLLGGQLRLRLADPGGAALGSDALPAAELLAGLPAGAVEIEATRCTLQTPQFCSIGTGEDQPRFVLRGSVTSVRVVPEPATGALLGAGLATLASARRGRRGA